MLTPFLEIVRDRINRPLQYYQDICVRCGACIDACHFYATSRDPVHIPAQRMMLVRKALQASNGWAKWYREAEPADDRLTGEIQRAIWECTGCRRCATFCPFDLDTALLVSVGRYALMNEGTGLEEATGHGMILEIGNAEISKGEIIEDLKDFYVEQIKLLEERLQGEFAPDLQIPVDKKGARVLYVPLVGEHATVPAAKVFHAAGEDWTLSLFTATNHSFFVGDMSKAKQAAQWIVDEARRLEVQAIVYPECGHATRTLMAFFEGWYGDQIAGIERMNLLELVASYMREGKIRVQANAFDTPVTYHDPCNLGRNGGLMEEPRMMLHAVASDFREFKPNRQLNWCCGGGGGLIAVPEMKDIRMRAGKKKADQIRQTEAQWVVTACENCKTQIGDLNDHYGLGIEVKGVVDLVADALVI
jgi:Fe-S oxidoreductase